MSYLAERRRGGEAERRRGGEAVDAVCCELVSGMIFPVYREFTGNSRYYGANAT